MEEIALILGGIARLAERESVDRRGEPRVVAGGEMRGAETRGPLERDAELDLPVAEHVRVRRASGLLLAQKMSEHALAVFRRELDPVEDDAELGGYRPCILEVARGGAVGIVLVLVPVAHEEPLDLPARFLEEQRGDRGIDASGEADDDARAGRKRCRVVREHPRIVRPAAGERA